MKKLALLLSLVLLGTLTQSFAQDDVMDDGDYYEPESRPAQAADDYYDEAAPPADTEEYIPQSEDAPVYDNAGPSTPSEALKDFNNAQDDRMDQLDSYEEDY